jgi:uridine kinase
MSLGSTTEVLIIGISSPSGGGKTAITKRTTELLADSIAIHFDDYDFDTVHPESYRIWLERGADFNDWKTPRLTHDLSKLKAGESIVSPIDGTMVQPKRYVVFDDSLGYAHAETAGLIDFMVFIDTPLDVALARRMLRTFALAQRGNVEHVIESLIAELTAYLEYARHAYCELEKQVKTKCDLVLDGRTSIDDLARQLVDVAKHLSFARRPC